MINPTFLYNGQGATVTHIKAVTLYGIRKTTKLYGTIETEDGGSVEHICELSEPLTFGYDWLTLEAAVTYSALRSLTSTGTYSRTSTYKRLHALKVDDTAYRVHVKDPIHIVEVTLTDGTYTITKDDLTFDITYIDGACYKEGMVGSIDCPFASTITGTGNCGLTDTLFDRCNNLLLETLQ